LADATLITEAALKSGSLHTARFTLEQGKDVLAVPGPITSETSVGTNNLIKAGATPITEVEDIFHTMKWQPSSLQKPKVCGDTPEEQAILDLIASGIGDGVALAEQSGLEARVFNQSLTMLEITGKIRAAGGNTWTL
jgi:DNA processing protein